MEPGVVLTVTMAVLKQPVEAAVKVTTAVPVLMPVTTPEPVTVATGFGAIENVPEVASLNVVVVPTQRVREPVIGAGKLLTKISIPDLQPAEDVTYIESSPPDTPVTIPLEEPTVAMDVRVLVHVPPPGTESVMLVPGHNDVTPETGPGNGLIVIIFIAAQMLVV